MGSRCSPNHAQVIHSVVRRTIEVIRFTFEARKCAALACGRVDVTFASIKVETVIIIAITTVVVAGTLVGSVIVSIVVAAAGPVIILGIPGFVLASLLAFCHCAFLRGAARCWLLEARQKFNEGEFGKVRKLGAKSR